MHKINIFVFTSCLVLQVTAVAADTRQQQGSTVGSIQTAYNRLRNKIETFNSHASHLTETQYRTERSTIYSLIGTNLNSGNITQAQKETLTRLLGDY